MYEEYQLPDLLRDWPWTRRLSLHYLQVQAESKAWLESFRPFDSRAQKAYDACDFNLAACLMYTNRDDNFDFVRVGCDLINFYFVYDEYTDVADVSVARSLASTVTSVMKNPGARPDNPHILGEMKRQFWERASKLASPGSACFEHFIAATERYVNGVAKEIEDRTHNRVRPLEEFIRLRRDTAAARSVLGLCEFGLNLPNEVIEHPIMSALTLDAVDLTFICNDVHSYIRESSSGLGDHNFITTIMTEYHLDLQGAFNWLGTYSDAVISRFLSNLKQIPSWDPNTDRRVQMYIDGIGQCVRGNDDWSYESKRYYGNDGPRIREDGILKISRDLRPNLPWLDLEEAKAEGTEESHIDSLDSAEDKSG